MTRIGVLLCFGVLCSCRTAEPDAGSETQTEASTDSSDSSDSGSETSNAPDTPDTDDLPPSVATLFHYLEAACPWESTCNGTPLESCFGILAEGDLALFANNYLAAGLADRITCARDATSCSEWEACSPTSDALLGGLAGNVADHPCPGDADIYCDPQTDILSVCIGASAGDSPFEVRDLALEGMASDTGQSFRDEPKVPCQTHACDGALVRACPNSATVTSDCRFLHPDFECEPSSLECAVAEPECESNAFNNSGGSAQCQDDTTAVVCMSGKRFTISCAVAGASCVNQGDLDATCE